MRWISQECSREELAEWALMAWAIWNARNRFVFETHQSPPMQIMNEAVLLGKDYLVARSSVAHGG